MTRSKHMICSVQITSRPAAFPGDLFLNGNFELLLAKCLCETCAFYLTQTLKLGLMLFFWWLAILEQLVCNLVRDDIVVLFCCRRINRQFFYCCLYFLAAVYHVGVSDEVLPGPLSLLR